MILHLHANEAALEAALSRELEAHDARAAIEVGVGLSSIGKLLREAQPRGAVVHALAEEMLLRELERAGRTGVARLRPLVAAMRRAGVTPAELRELAPRLIGAPGADARRLADVLERYEVRLGEHRDAAQATREALRRLEREDLSVLRDVEAVTVHVAPLDPLARAVVDALVRRGLPVRCEVPALPRGDARGAAAVWEDSVDGAITAALRTLEAGGDTGLEAIRVELGAGPLPVIFGAATPSLEAREVARRVRDRIAAGAAPDDIAIVADDRARRAELQRALMRYGVPVEREAPEALSSAAVRVVLAAQRLGGDGFSRDRLVDLLSSRYVATGTRVHDEWIHPSRLVRLLREVVPTAADPAGHRAALERWVEARPADRRDQARGMVRHLVRLIDAITAPPERATLADHVAALTTLIERLDVFTRARGFRRGAPPAPGSAVADALARDQAALRALVDQLELLPRAAAQVGLQQRVYDRAELGALLAIALAEARLPNGGGRGAAVRLSASTGLLPGMPILVLSGVEEGALPRPAEEDPLLGDDARRVLDRALGREVFGLSDLGERRALLAIAAARASAREVTLTWSRADADGRAHLAGAMVLHARAAGASETRGALTPVPTLGEAREPGELIARLGLERAQPELRAALAAHDAPRLARVERMVAIERARDAFFAGRGRAGRYDGFVADEDVRAALVAGPLPGGAPRPLSASTLQRYVECPGRFFFESVLRLRVVEEQGDDLDELQHGSLLHLALELLFRRWQAASAFPLRGVDAERAAIDTSLTEAAERWRAERPSGHELVWRARLASIRRILEGVWQREVKEPPAPGHVPTHFERSFHGLTVAGDGDEPPLHLTGKIDRVDIGRDEWGMPSAAVIDYKAGRMNRRASELADEALGTTSWQLPLYAAALRAQEGVSSVDMKYYALRDLKTTRKAPAPDWIRLERGGGEETLGDRLLAQVRRMRAGHFDIVPVEEACTRCELQAVCRVVHRREDEDLPR